MSHLSPHQLRQLISRDDILVSSEESSHLETCKECQRQLSRLSGEGEWMADWLQAVSTETREIADAWTNGHLSRLSSIVVAIDSSGETADRVTAEPVRLDFLDPPQHPELLGRLGRYDIERLIGMGGFGVVLKARDSELNRIVAIKVLAPHLMGSGAARQRFAREAQASAAVVHDHVVPIYDVVSSESACYFVMQYIPGRSLQERVDREGPLPVDEILRIAMQTAAGLEAAHEQGLIHRDVKPGNILLEDTVDRVLISDFGLARAADDASLTRSGTITGTPHYMSPEQARGASIDIRSDLFSLGSVIYFMATGHSPFRAEQTMAVLNRICHEPHRPLTRVRPDLPIELSRIAERLLDKSPDRRFASARKVRETLSRTLSDLQSGRIRPRNAPSWSRHIEWTGTAAKSVALLAILVAFLWIGARLVPNSGAGMLLPSLLKTTVPTPESMEASDPQRTAEFDELLRNEQNVIAEFTAMEESLDRLQTKMFAASPAANEFDDPWVVETDSIETLLDQLDRAWERD